jgi:hypothetical protein
MRILLAIIVMFSLGACATSSGQKVDKEAASKFVNGKTTYAEVVKELGKPSSKSKNTDGLTMIFYNESHQKISALTYIPIAGMFAPPPESGSDTVQFVFDKKLVLISQITNENGVSSEDMAK